MAIVPENILCDSEQKYTCSECADTCCKVFSVKVDEDVKFDLEKLDCVKDLLRNNNKSFERASNQRYYLPSIYDGEVTNCLFYDKNKRCLIHSNYGYDFKPPECQMYPFSVFFDSESNVHIEVSYVCKSILENYGEKIENIKHDIIKNHLNLEFFPESYPINESILSQKEVFKLAEILKENISNTDKTLDDIVLRHYLIINNFKKFYKDSSTFDEILEKSIIKADSGTIYSHRGFIYKHINIIYLVNLLLYSTYSRHNALFKNANKLLATYVKLYKDITGLSKNANLPTFQDNIDLGCIKYVKFNPDNEADKLIRRYLRSNVIKHKYLSGENFNLNFFNRVIIYYSLIKLFSTISAISNNTENTQFTDIAKSISLIEYVFCHTNTTLIPVKSLDKIISKVISMQLKDKNIVYNLITKGIC